MTGLWEWLEAERAKLHRGEVDDQTLDTGGQLPGPTPAGSGGGFG